MLIESVLPTHSPTPRAVARVLCWCVGPARGASLPVLSHGALTIRASCVRTSTAGTVDPSVHLSSLGLCAAS